MSMRHIRRPIACLSFAVAAVLCVSAPSSAVPDSASPAPPEAFSSRKLSSIEKAERRAVSRQMSAGGYWAHLAATGRLQAILARARSGIPARKSFDPNASDDDDEPYDDPDNGVAIPGGQAEFAIAVDVTGQNIVIGYNDTRGFTLTPLSLSGLIVSHDGGVTFADKGQLPANNVASGTPQVFGDPDVKYVPGGGGCQFIYSSILVLSSGLQTLSLHRSTDCGETWQGPFEVTPATLVNDSADKEFIDVDPETNRVLISWTNFTPTTAEIFTSFSDNVMSATPPTWSARRILEGVSGSRQGSVPRFAGNGSLNAYVAWFASSPGSIKIARSVDNGVSWSAPASISTVPIPASDQIPGNDRIHVFPSMAVDRTAGARSGWVYVVYAVNTGPDGTDIAFAKSRDAGASFSTPQLINANPGADRSQWFPTVTVDNNGRVAVTYYDQGSATSGDGTELTWLYSDDGGTTWAKPSPLTDRPFHAGYGNDTGQPNLGDYIGATTFGGQIHAVWAGSPPTLGFANGQPSTRMNSPDANFKKTNIGRAALQLDTLSFTDSNANGNIDPGERIALTLPLRNYVNNPVIGNVTYTSVSGTLSLPSPIPGVTIASATSAYANIGSLATVPNTTPLVLQLAAAFVPGTKIELALTVTTAQGVSTVLPFTLDTGTPVSSTLYAENFDGASGSALPAGWTAVHAAGVDTVPWVTTTNFCGLRSTMLFHPNTGVGSRFERAWSPVVTMPSTFGYVTLDFDICYDTEDEPSQRILAYDGLTLRITDQSDAPRILRSVLAEAFAESILTQPGNFRHFPKHLSRSSDPNYFEDMSVWAGDSGGWKHVTMRLPVTGGLEAASKFQLRWEYTEDANGTCADVRPGHVCGVGVDNIVIKGVNYASSSVDLRASALTDAPDPVAPGGDITYSLGVTNDGGAGNFVASNAAWSTLLPSGTTFVALTAAAGWTCATPAVGAAGTISCTAAVMPAGTASFSLVAHVGGSIVAGTILSAAFTLSMDTTDTNPANNVATATTTVGQATAALDIDGNGSVDALTDGLLAIRYLFGLRGPSLIAGAVGLNATRFDPTSIGDYIQAHLTAFDIDGNNATDALTDGLMIIRYLFGLRGGSLVAGAIGTGASRTTAQEIETYLGGLVP